MKYIKVNKQTNNVEAYLESSEIHLDSDFIEVSEFPDKSFNWQYINGVLIKKDKIVPAVKKIVIQFKKLDEITK